MNRAANVEAMSPKDKVLWNLWGLIMRHFDEDGKAEGLIDAEIQKLGYRKVTTCEKCDIRSEEPTGQSWNGFALYHCGFHDTEVALHGYCSAGVPKEGE